MSESNSNQGPFNVYVLGLVICAICVGVITEAVYGWMVVGLGLMTIATLAITLSYLNDGKNKDKEE